MADPHPADALLDPGHPTVLEVALAIADADLRDRHAETGVTLWWMAPCGPIDHLYATCPGLRRSLRPGDEPVRCDSVLYPEAGDVCGWCLRVWRARQANTEPELAPAVRSAITARVAAVVALYAAASYALATAEPDAPPVRLPAPSTTQEPRP